VEPSDNTTLTGSGWGRGDSNKYQCHCAQISKFWLVDDTDDDKVFNLFISSFNAFQVKTQHSLRYFLFELQPQLNHLLKYLLCT
jgi:hypothetical protein